MLKEELIRKIRAAVERAQFANGIVDWVAAMKEELLKEDVPEVSTFSDLPEPLQEIKKEMFEIQIKGEKPKVKTVEEWIKFVQDNVEILNKPMKAMRISEMWLMRAALMIADNMFSEEDMHSLLNIYAGGAELLNVKPRADLMMEIVERKWFVDLSIEDGMLRIREEKKL